MHHFIYNFLSYIPKNKVVSYGQLAHIFGIHHRYLAKLLSQNQNQNKFPCYKVVNSDGTIGGYNLGVEEKIKRLENDGIKVQNYKISPDAFWDIGLKNFFVAIPLEDGIDRFKNMIDTLKKQFGKNITYQNPFSAHVTLIFFGNISLKQFHGYIKIFLQNKEKFKQFKNKKLVFDRFGSFGERVYYLGTKENFLNDFYDIFADSLGLKQPNFIPHLTIMKNKNMLNLNIKFLKDIVSKYSFNISINKLRWYCGIDNYFQIPLIDTDL